MNKIIKNVSVSEHYDLLINENNDPVLDPELLRNYMDKWDGQKFIDVMELTEEKDVLEIGVGTGRIAVKTATKCRNFTGIDLSEKTIERAKENLALNNNVTLICDDFMKYEFRKSFDVIYSTLTFMHIENKASAIKKIANLLKQNGRFVVSIDKNQDEYIDFGCRRIKKFPDNPYDIKKYIKEAELIIKTSFETEFATVITAKK